MTEERKEELRKLLEDALENIVIRRLFEKGTMSKEQYIKILRHRNFFYGIYVEHANSLNYLQYQPDIEDENIKSRLLEFIREELKHFIDDDNIGYSSYNVDGCTQDGFRLVKRSNSQTYNLSDISDVLGYLLKVSFAFGIDKAVLSFDQDSCPEGNYRTSQSITSLEGIAIETEIQICKGIRLIPIPRDIAFQLNHNLQKYHHRNRDKGTTLLIIERLRHSIFHKPSEVTYQKGQMVKLPFQVEANEIELSNQGMIMDFRETFCQALSLACNTMVMFDYFWDFSSVDVFRSDDVEQKTWYLGPIGRKSEVGQTEIEDAKQMYKILDNLDQKTKKRFWIASERWRKSKTHQNIEDKIIDLTIALESVYLPDAHESTYKLAVRASWYLGEDREDRERLFEVFKKIYSCRSTVVHGGDLQKKSVTIKGETIPMSKFVELVQDLCQQSIEKIMKQCTKDGRFPKNEYWDTLVLG